MISFVKYRAGMTFSPVLGELNYVIQKKVFLGSWKTTFSTEDREKFEEAVKLAIQLGLNVNTSDWFS